MHGAVLQRDGTAIRMTNFDVTLDGRLITAERGLYHPDTGIVELTGNVQLHFGANARTDDRGEALAGAQGGVGGCVVFQ